jgi:hypothetical protein
LQQQHDLSLLCYNNILMATNALQNNNVKNENAAKELNQYIGKFRSLQGVLQESEMIPTTQMVNGVMEADKGFKALLK